MVNVCRIRWYIFDSGVFLVKIVLCVGLYNYRLLEKIFYCLPRNPFLFLFLKEIYICITIINIIIICISDVCDALRWYAITDYRYPILCDWYAMFCDRYAIFEIWILIFVLKFFKFLKMYF